MTTTLQNEMHRRSFASEGTLPKATRRARKRVRGRGDAGNARRMRVGRAAVRGGGGHT